MRWGLGPVFVYDGLVASRRWQTYAVRAFGGAMLCVAIFTVVSSRTWSSDNSMSWREYAAIGESLFYGIIGVEITLVMLAAPAATAGAICVDRARGTLAHMLVTDLSDVEIVLGKLAARMLPVLGLVACSWPILAISSLLGGIDPMALVLAFAVLIAVALVGCSMALALSVWARKSHEVVMVVYTFWMAALLLWPIWYRLSRLYGATIGPPPDWALWLDPYYIAFAPYSVPGKLRFSVFSFRFSVFSFRFSVFSFPFSVPRSAGQRMGETGEHLRNRLQLGDQMKKWLIFQHPDSLGDVELRAKLGGRSASDPEKPLEIPTASLGTFRDVRWYR